MEKEKTQKETKPKEISIDEMRTDVKASLTFVRDISNYIKQMKDNGCVSMNFERKVQDWTEEFVRVVIGMPNEPKPQPYQPPAPTNYNQPAQPNYPQPRY